MEPQLSDNSPSVGSPLKDSEPRRKSQETHVTFADQQPRHSRLPILTRQDAQACLLPERKSSPESLKKRKQEVHFVEKLEPSPYRSKRVRKYSDPPQEWDEDKHATRLLACHTLDDLEDYYHLLMRMRPIQFRMAWEVQLRINEKVAESEAPSAGPMSPTRTRPLRYSVSAAWVQQRHQAIAAVIESQHEGELTCVCVEPCHCATSVCPPVCLPSSSSSSSTACATSSPIAPPTASPPLSPPISHSSSSLIAPTSSPIVTTTAPTPAVTTPTATPIANIAATPILKTASNTSHINSSATLSNSSTNSHDFSSSGSNSNNNNDGSNTTTTTTTTNTATATTTNTNTITIALPTNTASSVISSPALSTPYLTLDAPVAASCGASQAPRSKSRPPPPKRAPPARPQMPQRKPPPRPVLSAADIVLPSTQPFLGLSASPPVVPTPDIQISVMAQCCTCPKVTLEERVTVSQQCCTCGPEVTLEQRVTVTSRVGSAPHIANPRKKTRNWGFRRSSKDNDKENHDQSTPSSSQNVPTISDEGKKPTKRAWYSVR